MARLAQGEVVAIDGKTVRRSHDLARGQQAIHLVTAWASANSMTLGQVKVERKSNEITTIPKLLGLLALHGCIVTSGATVQPRCYISSLDAPAGTMLESVRRHWSIENSLHWTLDVTYREDQCRVRKDHAPQNLATLRQISQTS